MSGCWAAVEQLRTLDPATLAAALVVLGRRDNEADPHGIAVELVTATLTLTHDPVLDSYPGGRWHRPNIIRGVLQLDRWRYPPTGDRAAWITFGPAGPPPPAPADPASPEKAA